MSGVIRIITLASVIASVGCGATTSGSSGSTSAPVYTPPSSSAPSTTANTAPTEVNGNAYGVIPAGQGAILGAVIGAGGAIAATEGKDIELPAGSIIRIRID